MRKYNDSERFSLRWDSSFYKQAKQVHFPMPMCPENQPFQTFNATARPLAPWVQTMLNHIGDMEELKRQLKVLNERLADVREQQRQSMDEEAPPYGQKRFGDESSDGKSAGSC